MINYTNCQEVSREVYATVNYAPGSSSYIQTMSQIMKTLDVLLDYALNYNLVKMPLTQASILRGVLP